MAVGQTIWEMLSGTPPPLRAAVSLGQMSFWDTPSMATLTPGWAASKDFTISL